MTPPPLDLDHATVHGAETFGPETHGPETHGPETHGGGAGASAPSPPRDHDDPLALLEARLGAARSLVTVRDEMTVGAATIAIAVAALKEAAAILREIRSDLRAAAMPRADRLAIQRDIAAARARLWDLATAAAVNGTNLLIAPRALDATKDVTIVATLARGRSGEISLGAIDIDRSITALFGEAPFGEAGPRGLIDSDDGTGAGLAALDVSALTDRPTCQARLDRFARRAETVILGVNAALSHLSIARSRINLQASFIASLSDAAAAEEPAATFESALDLASALRTARETRALLMKQPLGIARLNSQTVLRLFRGL